MSIASISCTVFSAVLCDTNTFVKSLMSIKSSRVDGEHCGSSAMVRKVCLGQYSGDSGSAASVLGIGPAGRLSRSAGNISASQMMSQW